MRTARSRIHLTGIAAAAVAAASALASSVAAGGAVQAAPTSTSGVAFSMKPGQAAIVANYVVTPASRSAATAGAAQAGAGTDDQRADLTPKQFATSDGGAGTSAPAVKSDNTLSSLNQSNGSGPTPVPSPSFIGQQGSSTTCSYFGQGCNPPDMALAASPSAVLQGVNTQWEVLDTAGNVQPGWPVGAQSFFNVPNVTNKNGTPCDTAHGSQPFLSDPRALYDPVDHRFWAAELQVEGGLGVAGDCPFKSVYFIAVSQTSNPSGAWNVYEFEMSLGFPMAADFTQIGLSRDAVFFSANMFGTKKNTFYAEVFEANRAKMEQGLGGFTADGFFDIQGSGPGVTRAGVGPFLADTIQPVQNQDSTTGDGLFLDTNDGPDLLTGNLCDVAHPCKGVILWRMANPIAHDSGGAAPSLTGTLLPDTKPFAFPPAADEPTCKQCVDASDLRIGATPVLRNGVIHAGFETAVDNGSQVVPGIVTVDVSVGGTPSVSSGYFNAGGDTAVSYPAMVVDAGGNVDMVFEAMGSTLNPQTRITGRSGGQFSDPGRILKAGEASYRPSLCGTSALPVCRWGDYEATSWDGAGRVWFAGEYANTHTDPTVAPWFGRNWGTWMGALGS